MKRIGCINWDAAHPDTYFGNHTLRTLSRFPERLPFYTEGGEEGYRFRARSQADYDLELGYAAEAGIDFFAHCWYAREPVKSARFNPGEEYLGDHIHELSISRRMHEASPLRERIKLAAIIGAYEMNEGDYTELAKAMTMPYYERKQDGRPLLFLFDPLTELGMSELQKTLAATENEGIKPYVVALVNTCKIKGDEPFLSAADALSAYAEFGSAEIHTFAEQNESNLRHNALRGTHGLPSLPIYTTGWNPRPRIETRVPWISYDDYAYPATATPNELITAAEELAAALAASPELYDDEYVLASAWNEFEEGCWLCPTREAGGGINTERVQAFAKAAELLK